MERLQMNQLVKWKNRPNRKPLIMRGARQVGKTWLMKEFAQKYYTSHIYINFEDDEPLKSLFVQDFDMERIVQTIQIYTGKALNSSTLLLLDEIQEAPRGVTALKYFCEKRRDLHVIAAGSLLGIANNHNDSFPVGKVDFIDIAPLSFIEFLLANGKHDWVDAIHNRQWDVLNIISAQLRDCLLTYFYVGGMPEVVNVYISEHDFAEVRRI